MFLDYIIALVLVLISSLVLGVMILGASGGANESLAYSLSYFLGSSVGWAYYILTTYLWGRTLGKAALGMRVVKDDGSKPDFVDVLIRETAGKFVSAITLGIGYLWAFFHPHRRALHDLIADTMVIHEQPKEPDFLSTSQG